MSTSIKAQIAAQTDVIATKVEANPYAMVAGAFAVGFVLGGGLFTRLTGRIVKVALRAGAVAALPHLQGAVVKVAEQALAGGKPSRPKAS